MKTRITAPIRPAAGLALLLLAGTPCLRANPEGGQVLQGTATISSAGSQLTVNQSSSSAYINWQSFNSAAGETTTFNQPSASSVTWNYISDPNASIINGNINANGYVVLQNPNGFTIGGTATITAHGLVMTTASTPSLSLSGGGAWSFDTPPPTAQIINYGLINITGGGSAYLIGSDILNEGTISAPGGQIGLYAGQKVLVSMAADGRGLSAEVTVPEGSVDNQGRLIADGGSIAAQAKYVNQDGFIQANSVQDVNGTIELLASDSLTLGASSTISAAGDSTAVSAGGTVVIKSDNVYADATGSTIDISGGGLGGNGGQVEISGKDMSCIQSSVLSHVADGYTGGTLTIDPTDLVLNSAYIASLNSQIAGGVSTINLQADNNITLSAAWTVADSVSGATINLSAGNNIILNSSLKAGAGWSISLEAGTAWVAGTTPASGSCGVYLNGSSALQTKDGNITITAPNEVIVQSGAIRTIGGGSISVTTQVGNVNAGNNVNGFLFGQNIAPYYKVNTANLGGISTAAGGDVTITAGGDVISYLPVQSDYANAKNDAGVGAFGSQAGNVTITAGGNVYGHYVVANGVGTITAGGDIGASTSTLLDPDQAYKGFALSLISGSWEVNAPNGNIYVQDVRNPNGIFGERANASAVNYAGYHLFDYDSAASVTLNALGDVEITGYDAPHTGTSNPDTAIPLILPPALAIHCGGNLTLDQSVILFPSVNQSLYLFIGGDLTGVPNNGVPVNLEMSDSEATRWTDDSSFGVADKGTTLYGLDNPNPVLVQVGGNMEELNLYTTKETHLFVGGNIVNSGFVGQNLHATDTTTITAGGYIYNQPLYTFTPLSSLITSANPYQPDVWDSVFLLAVTPAMVAQLTSLDVASVSTGNGLAYYLKSQGYMMFPSDLSAATFGANPGFVYDTATLQLGFKGNMSTRLSAAQIAALEGGTFTVLVVDSKGSPILDASGHLQVKEYTFSASTAIATLNTESQNSTTAQAIGYLIGGPGGFEITAAALDLGYSPGIGSYGYGERFSALESVTGATGYGGASVSVNVAGDINLLTSSISSINGGDVTVNAGGNITIGLAGVNFPTSDCYGIYTSGYSDVKVTAVGDINIGGGCIGTFNGGDVYVESYNGDVNAGSGVNRALFVYTLFPDGAGGSTFGTIGDLSSPESLKVDPTPYGSGILAEYPIAKYLWPGGYTEPGNITVITHNGNITSGRGGISQFALNDTIGGGPTITLEAGLKGVTATEDQGNILLGEGGVVGGTINITATGKVEGLIVSQHDANIDASQSFSGTVLSGGSANFSGGGSISGTVVGIGGINTGSASLGNVTLLSSSVTGAGGGSDNTLGTSAAATSSAQAAAMTGSQATDDQASATDEEDQDKKKDKPRIRKVSRVTVILSSATPVVGQ